MDDIQVQNAGEVAKCSATMTKVWGKATQKFQKPNAVLLQYSCAMDKVRESLNGGLRAHVIRDMRALATELKAAFPNKGKVEDMEGALKRFQTHHPTATNAGFPILWAAPSTGTVKPHRADKGETQIVPAEAQPKEKEFEETRTYFIQQSGVLYSMALQVLGTDVSKWTSLIAFELFAKGRPSYYADITELDEVCTNVCAYGGHTVTD